MKGNARLVLRSGSVAVGSWCLRGGCKGQAHEEWKTLARAEQIKWHDAEDTKPVIYLGYPLYSTETQLQHFLDAIEWKITNHANMMKARSLSVLGRSLIANALLLSKLWHILRVTVTPNGWLSKIRRIIRGFIFPFSPHPSWSVACEPKSKGGLGVIDPEQQALALHNIHLHRLLEQVDDNPLSPVIRTLFQLYTGQRSLLPMMLMPPLFKPMLTPIPHLRHLSMLLKRLPPVQISDSWTPYTTQHIPLRLVLCTAITKSSKAPDIPIHFTVGTILQHLPNTDSFYPRHIRKNQRLLGQIIEALRVGQLRWCSLLQQQTNMLAQRKHPPATPTIHWSATWRWHISKDR
ncbi:hypothetical protein, partial, partial [Absidia glauca]